jgi:hypothetical protein
MSKRMRAGGARLDPPTCRIDGERRCLHFGVDPDLFETDAQAVGEHVQRSAPGITIAPRSGGLLCRSGVGAGTKSVGSKSLRVRVVLEIQQLRDTHGADVLAETAQRERQDVVEEARADSRAEESAASLLARLPQTLP